MHSANRNCVTDASVQCGISWNGFNLEGDAKSIEEVRRLLNQQERLKWFEYEYRRLLDAKCPCKAKSSC